MSTTCRGAASRIDSSGSRLCPPASTFASSPSSPSIDSASPSDDGCEYSKGAGFTEHLADELSSRHCLRAFVADKGCTARTTDQGSAHACRDSGVVDD